MAPQSISLFQLNQRIKGVLEDAFLTAVWVKAEIGELKVNRNGHCYLDLIEKDLENDNLIARSRAVIWGYTFRMLKAFFESSTGQPLGPGLKVLVKVSVEFQELYGLSLIIKDIDPSYTMGDLARKRREVIMKLEQEGVLAMNRELEMAVVPQKIAIISSPTAAGYGDFVDQLDGNPWGVIFYHHLFPAIMQGPQSESSLIDALEKIYAHASFFDAVVLIRGGGASVDLMCFDSYRVAYHLAQFPLPVITGIGHERDETVADLVAHTHLKTPTAVAAWLIDRAGDFLGVLDDRSARLSELGTALLRRERQRTERLATTFAPRVNRHMQKSKHLLERQAAQLPALIERRLGSSGYRLGRYQQKLAHRSRLLLQAELHRHVEFTGRVKTESLQLISGAEQHIKFLQQTNRLNDPHRLLKKGYSITFHNGRLLKEAATVEPGDVLTTRLNNGALKSRVVDKEPGNREE